MKKYNPITMSHGGIHKAKMIPVKIAAVDIRIIPVVKWLNNYESIMTVGCCGGDKKRNIPQVSFICSDQIILSSIMRDIYDFNDARPIVLEEGMQIRKGTIDMSLSYMPHMLNPIVYGICFFDQDILKKFIEWKRL